jgi:flagellar motor switch protein FliG
MAISGQAGKQVATLFTAAEEDVEFAPQATAPRPQRRATDFRTRQGETDHGKSRPAVLNGRQKAAVIVRLLLSEGAKIPLSSLPEHLQAALTEQIGTMRLIDRETLRGVVEEFSSTLEQVGLSFPNGIDGAITMLDGHISANAANRLRRLAGDSAKADPWERLANIDVDRLVPVIQSESIEIGAVMLSKLSVQSAAGLLEKLPGEVARKLAYAMSMTGNVAPDVVRRIGQSIANQLEAQPARAFDGDPMARVGAILNSSPAQVRDALLASLQDTDAVFAKGVRKSILTFGDLRTRLAARDVSRFLREVPQVDTITALKAALDKSGSDEAETAEYILGSISQRLAGSLREEMESLGSIKIKTAEDAMSAMIAALRDLIDAGEVTLISTEAEL